jgi:uncharacterized iron-regulated membrane protein
MGSIVIIAIPGLYVEGHVLLGLPLRKLVEPIGVLLGLFLLLGPFLYWGKERASLPKPDIRPLIAVGGIAGMIFFLLVVFYGFRLDIIEGRTARELAITALCIMPLGVTLSYFVLKRSF